MNLCKYILLNSNNIKINAEFYKLLNLYSKINYIPNNIAEELTE